MEDGHERTARKINIRVPYSLIVTLLVQAAAVLIWASQLDARVNSVEEQVISSRGLNEKFARVEERLDDVKQQIGEVKRQMDRITERLLK